MADAASLERYEEAARYRDILQSIETTLERQKMVTHGGDMDVVGFHRKDNAVTLVLLFIRGGTVTGSRSYTFSWELDDAEAIASFLGEYYGGDVFVPVEILLPLAIPENIGLLELLAEKKGKKVALSVPRRGMKLELVELAARNAETSAVEHHDRQDASIRVLQELKDRLNLAKLPTRIECYDISTFQGKQSVGSRVTFVDGKPFKEGYRRYRIRNDGQNDDFGMLTEVLARRANRAVDDPLPDLLIVDGGLGQLGVLTRVLADLQLQGIETAALAKSRVFSDMTDIKVSRSAERVFRPGRKNPVVLKQNSKPLLLLAQIRDEAHRFAVTYHKLIRDKETLRSELEDISGIGPKLSRALLRYFGSLDKIRTATLSDIASVPGIPNDVATAVIARLSSQT
jgi:excinuclease ABC subunit C